MLLLVCATHPGGGGGALHMHDDGSVRLEVLKRYPMIWTVALETATLHREI
jgi:hypothetical protein